MLCISKVLHVLFKHGWTAFMCACGKGRNAVVRLLLGSKSILAEHICATNNVSNQEGVWLLYSLHLLFVGIEWLDGFDVCM
jgi:hypothetical protein